MSRFLIEVAMRILAASLLVAVASTLTAGQHKSTDVPVEYFASVNMVGALGAAATTLKIHVDSYTSDRDRTTLLTALRTNGYDAFLPAFRKVPIVGYVQIKDQKWNLRWAQHQPRALGQVVTAAADRPIYFVGGGNVDAKPRAGYEMALIRLEVDTIGMGTGTFAPAARIKATNDTTSVEVAEYSGAPLKITTVTRIFQ